MLRTDKVCRRSCVDTLHHAHLDAAGFRRLDPEPWILADRDAWLIIDPFAITGTPATPDDASGPFTCSPTSRAAAVRDRARERGRRRVRRLERGVRRRATRVQQEANIAPLVTDGEPAWSMSLPAASAICASCDA